MTNYQRMCAAAKEIQEAWEPKVGDMIYILSTDKIIHLDCLELADDLLTGMYWLPGIEDLITIGKRKVLGSDILFLDALARWNLTVKAKYLDDTVPERILRFLMSELHNKTWDGKE